ncbi:hypothetical protein JG688_00010325 [Phytophthora aleatoria]|uniref:Uncharacterized protein n=1 Tax=Phytophthora aleatoria TaxID=2496075 RepID=A0A8J5IEP4_9STRA|nr:hypothetical protein JG688_00010325 [Phytophthora aleatoria]
MPFTETGTGKCFKRMLSQVLPDPIPVDVAILTTMEGLQAFMEFDNPVHPWQTLRWIFPAHACLFDVTNFDPLAPGSTRAPIKTRTLPLEFHCCYGARFQEEARDPNHDRGILKQKRTLWKRLPGE